LIVAAAFMSRGALRSFPLFWQMRFHRVDAEWNCSSRTVPLCSLHD
jgi:hypothetical protein